MGKIQGAAARLDALAMRVPVLRVAWGMFAHPTRGGDLLLVGCSMLLMAAFLVVQMDGPYDTDGWFLLATGKEIVENGIPYTNPWAYDAQGGEYAVVVQQWLHCVILYAAYSVFGYAGCEGVAVVMGGVLLLVMYRTMRVVSQAAPATCFALCSLAVVGCSFYMSVRPTMWTMIALCVAVSLCTLWRRTGKATYLIGLPFLMLVHAQLHMSMMWLDVFAACCFLLPVSLPSLREKGIKGHLGSCAPLAAAVLAMCVASFANPYGADGALYLVNSYGAAGYGNAIKELQGVFETSGLLIFIFFLYLALPALIALAQRKAPCLPLALLWLAGSAAYFSSVRSAWVAALGCALLVASQRTAATAFGKGERLDDPGAHVLLGATACAVAAGCVAYTAAMAPDDASAYEVDSDDSLYGLCSWEQGDADVGPLADIVMADPGRVYVSSEIVNSYLEWKGAKVVFDTRPELWEPGITGCEDAHPWREFIDHAQNEDVASEYIANGGWRWYIVPIANAETLCERFGLEEAASTGMFALLQPTGYGK